MIYFENFQNKLSAWQNMTYKYTINPKISQLFYVYSRNIKDTINFYFFILDFRDGEMGFAK